MCPGFFTITTYVSREIMSKDKLKWGCSLLIVVSTDEQPLGVGIVLTIEKEFPFQPQIGFPMRLVGMPETAKIKYAYYNEEENRFIVFFELGSVDGSYFFSKGQLETLVHRGWVLVN